MFKTVTVLALLSIATASAQTAISARSGLIHYVEGTAKIIGGGPVNMTAGKFPDVREGKVLETSDGRAEVLLNPGVFLRLAENSSFKMISDKLTDTHIEILSGSALMEVDELAEDNMVTIHAGDSRIRPLKPGLYAISAEANELRVFEGQAIATLDSSTLVLGRGRLTKLSPELLAVKFDRKNTDALYAWTRERAGLIAQANQNVSLTSARGGYRSRQSSMWAWYPTMGIFTFLPGRGRIYSPFGYYWYSPMAMWSIYTQPPVQAYSGYQGADSGWTGRPSASGPSMSAASAASSGEVSRGAVSSPAPAAAPVSSPGGGGRDR